MAKEHPALGTGGNPSITTGGYESFIDAFLAAARQGVGGIPTGSLTIVSGTATPTESLVLKVDTEASASTDNLDNMAVTNVANGRLAILRAQDPSRTVVVRSAQGGSGQFSLAGGLNFSMDDTEKCILLVLESTTWVELARFHSDDSVAQAAFYAYGTAIFLNSGTGAGNVPLVSDILGARTFYYPAVAMGLDATDAPTLFYKAYGAGKPVTEGLSFSNATEQLAYFSFVLPKGVDPAATISFSPVYLHEGGQTGGLDGVVFTIAALARGDGDSLNTAFTTEGNSIKDASVANAEHRSPAAVFVPSGTPAREDTIHCRVRRNVAHASDDLNIPAILTAVIIKLQSDGLNDD